MTPYTIGAEIPLAAHKIVYRVQIPIAAQAAVVGHRTALPRSCRLLALAQARNGEYAVDLWYEAEPAEVNSTDDEVEIVVFGTGYRIEPGHVHLGTVVMSDGYVWHLYLKLYAQKRVTYTAQDNPPDVEWNSEDAPRIEPSGSDWRQRISKALGLGLGLTTYTLDEAVEKIGELREKPAVQRRPIVADRPQPHRMNDIDPEIG